MMVSASLHDITQMWRANSLVHMALEGPPLNPLHRSALRLTLGWQVFKLKSDTFLRTVRQGSRAEQKALDSHTIYVKRRN